MKITNPPIVFETATTLDPRDVTDNFNVIHDQLKQATDKRFVHSVLSFPFQRSATQPYTNADTETFRSYKFNAPFDMIIERAFLSYYGTATAAVDITLQLGNGGGNVAGVERPYMSVTPTASDTTVTDYNATRVRLAQGTNYQFIIESDGTFSSKHTFLNLHIIADRHTATGTENITTSTRPRFSAEDAVDADTFNTAANAASATAALVENITAVKGSLFVAHDITTATAANVLTWKVLGTYEDNTATKVVSSSMYYVVTNEVDSLAFGFALKDAAGATAFSHNVSNTGSSGSNVERDTTLTGDHSEPTEDYTLVASYSSGTKDIDKTYCILWYC